MPMSRRERQERKKVSLTVLAQREAICATCEFSTKSCGGISVCRIWGCRWKNQIRRRTGACALGNRAFPRYKHLTMKWTPIPD